MGEKLTENPCFAQMFLITHLEEVKDMMGNVLLVKDMEDGTSNVEVLA